MTTYQELFASVPQLLSLSDSIKVVEVAKKYDQPNVRHRLFGAIDLVDPTGNPQFSRARIHQRELDDLPLQ
jgi:hypothetical protein